MTWTPDDLGPDERAEPHRQVGDPTALGKAERLWARRRAEEETGRRTPSLTGRVHRAVERYRAQADVVADALLAATVAAPPPKRGGMGERRGSDVSDPALAQITATHDAIDRGLTAYGHLLDDCELCGPKALRPHNDDRSDTIGRLLDDDWTAIVDHLTAVSATSPYAVTRVVAAARQAHEGGAERFEDWLGELHRDGAEPDVLANLATRFERMASRMSSLADSLGQWVPGTRVRQCADGCGGGAPPRGKGATCERCRQRNSRAV